MAQVEGEEGVKGGRGKKTRLDDGKRGGEYEVKGREGVGWEVTVRVQVREVVKGVRACVGDEEQQKSCRREGREGGDEGEGGRAVRCEEDSKDCSDSEIGEGDNTWPRCDHD